MKPQLPRVPVPKPQIVHDDKRDKPSQCWHGVSEDALCSLCLEEWESGPTDWDIPSDEPVD